VSLRIGSVLAVLVFAAAIGACSSAGPLGEYRAARTLHLAPDGRLIVTDLGSGRNDGAVVAVEVASGRQTVLMRDLPSTRHSGQAHADLAGPSGAAMAADGTVCAAIGDATAPNAGFAALRCTSGLTVDLEAFQASNKLPSNPYDVISTAVRVGTSATERPTTSCTSTGPARSRSSPTFQTSPRVGSAAATARGFRPG
jgi:hypothetical protein